MNDAVPNYQIVLAPDLDVSAADFAAAWNADEQTNIVAQAHVASSATKTYDPELINSIVIGVLSSLATSALYDLIKHVLTEMIEPRKVPQSIEIQQIDQPDGTRLLIVKRKR